MEDDPQDVASTKRAFHSQGIDNPVHVARNGKVALDMLKGRDLPALNPIPRIILLDLDLPEMGGLAFLAELRKDPLLKACSVFVITGQGSHRDLLQAYDLHVAGFIVKPFQYSSFVDIISTLNTFWNLIELPN